MEHNKNDLFTGINLLTFAGINQREKQISSFQSALHQTMVMAEDISKNGTEGYKTLDDLLKED